MDKIQERKAIKQELWKIRLFIEKDIFFLSDRQLELKSIYENLPGFTSWSDFPEKWDIGDPYKTKVHAFDDIDRENFKRISGKPYETIVSLEKKAEVEATEVEATEVEATEVEATEVEATEVEATEVEAEDNK